MILATAIAYSFMGIPSTASKIIAYSRVGRDSCRIASEYDIGVDFAEFSVEYVWFEL